MKIYLASDHAGFELKEKLKDAFEELDLIDLGTNSADSVDYPDYAKAACQSVLKDTESRAILICGSGIGMSIAANRFKGIRAALVMNTEIAALSRKHNNSNVLALAARFISTNEAIEIVKTWLKTDFEGARHQNRLNKIDS